MATDAAPKAPTPSEILPTPPRGSSQNPARRLSEDIALLLREFEVEAVTLREVLAVLHGRGFVLLILLLALPFATPIPLPGLSTPFGLVIALIGARLALGQKPWLPARLLDIKLPPGFFAKLFSAARKILRFFEYFLRPRLLWMTRSTLFLQVHAIPIFLAAALLLLPLPVPFSNFIPALSILLISAGLLERDGLFILLGYLAFLGSAIFFGILGLAGAHGFDAVKHWLFG